MEAYTDFALVYDTFMDETPYEEWCDYIVELLEKYGCPAAVSDTDELQAANLAQERNTILDLGCGTGTLTELLARRGYDMIGVDNADEMLQIALEKKEKSGLDILYLLQDMREFELYGTVGAVISVCDSLNYLLDEEDLLQTFRLVNNYLYPQGIFIFDFNTVHKYADIIGDATIAENREECSFIWENYYHEAEEINEYDLTIFVEDDNKGGEPLFRRFQETHYQRGYRLEQMQSLVEQSGLEFLKAIDADTHGAVSEESERIYIVARKGADTVENSRVMIERNDLL
jgi:SAM-dependent methyltransferase